LSNSVLVILFFCLKSKNKISGIVIASFTLFLEIVFLLFASK